MSETERLPEERTQRPALKPSIESMSLMLSAMKDVTVGTLLQRVTEIMNSVLKSLTDSLAGMDPAIGFVEVGSLKETLPFSSGTDPPAENVLPGSGSSSSGSVLLLAILVSLIGAFLRRGRFWALYRFTKPKLIPHLIPERPD